MSWNHGSFFSAYTLSQIDSSRFLDRDEIVECKFTLSMTKLKTGLFKSEEIPYRMFFLTNFQLLAFEHDRAYDYALFRIPYDEIINLEFTDSLNKNLKISIGDNRGSITWDLGPHANKIYALLKNKTQKI